MAGAGGAVRIGADIGGTFTDVVAQRGGEIFSAKVLTSYAAPEQAILDGIAQVLGQAGAVPGDVTQVIHGTTLATNALIEKRGAKTALVTTEGFRDVIEMRHENRFEQYDLNLRLPDALIARQHRYPVAGRLNADGEELLALDEAALHSLGAELATQGYDSIAVGFIHSWQNDAHERRAREILSEHLPGVPVSLSSEVSPQMREYERFSTVCANAYVRPQIESYLKRLEARLKERGINGPLFMIHSGGGLMALETAMEFPVRLVESGPAGGAIFAAEFARRFGLGRVVSYDMGGTTAKIALIEDGTPATARTFEVARSYRFKKGSGMPVSIPVIEMIEIGAGGGSLASVDALGRIQTGPESAGSEPGPACYGQGGARPAITDADLVLGKIDAANFAGGAIRLSEDAAREALHETVGEPLGLTAQEAAFGVAEVVDENMANAARVHAVEHGRDISENVMIAFGGAAPLHAARLCEKLSIDQCLIPGGAGVGSAIGFLMAPFSYEAVASNLTRLSEFDAGLVNNLLAGLKSTAERFVRKGTDALLTTEITAFMRYAGQGWEIPVQIDDNQFSTGDEVALKDSFRACYAEFFGRPIDGLGGLEIEIVTWSVKVTEIRPETDRAAVETGGIPVSATATRPVFDPTEGVMLDYGVHDRENLSPGDTINGPAVIVERETATIVTSPFNASILTEGTIILHRKGAGQ